MTKLSMAAGAVLLCLLANASFAQPPHHPVHHHKHHHRHHVKH